MTRFPHNEDAKSAPPVLTRFLVLILEYVGKSKNKGQKCDKSMEITAKHLYPVGVILRVVFNEVRPPAAPML